MLAAPTVDGEAVDEAVRDVLNRPSFVNNRPGWWSEVTDAINQWIAQRFLDVFGSEAAPIVAWMVFATIVGLAVIVGYVAIRRTRGGRRIQPGPRVTVAMTRSPDEWLADAHAARDAGDRAEAVRCAYRAVVALLAARGVVDEVPGRTVGEYRAQVAARDPVRVEPFSHASDVFEQIWYARRPASGDDVERVFGVAQQLADA